jgi:hypothetical protein
MRQVQEKVRTPRRALRTVFFRAVWRISQVSGTTAAQGVFVDGSAKRYIEELAVPEEQPIYLPGDTISLRLRITHSVNLGSVWAVFRRLPQRGEEPGDSYITLPGKHYRLSQAGPLRVSEANFKIEVSRDRHLPGNYVLEAVRAYPYELDGWDDLIMEVEVRGEIRFRMAEESGVHCLRLTGWKFD